MSHGNNRVKGKCHMEIIRGGVNVIQDTAGKEPDVRNVGRGSCI